MTDQKGISILQLALAKEKESREELENFSDELECEIERLRQEVDQQTKAAFENQSRILRLEEALALSAEELLTYKEYYGTSINQVRHLQECDACYLGIDADEVRCFNYPAE